ncbi:MAG: Mth938-like domain-containing protein [Lysobacterales bacterium]
MEFNLEVPQDQFFIRSVSEKGIRVHQDYFNQPFILSGQRIIPEWGVTSVEDINEESLQALFELQPEVVLIGTGNTQVFLPPATQVHFFRRGIGFEVMTTDAACRTFNVLVAEGREVVAALLPLTP